MSLATVKEEVNELAAQIHKLAADIRTLDAAVDGEENPDYSMSLAEILADKMEQYHILEQKFKTLLQEYDKLCISEGGAVSFTARKILKVVG